MSFRSPPPHRHSSGSPRKPLVSGRDAPVGRLTTTAHWRASSLPQWAAVALTRLQYSRYRVTYCGMELRDVLRAYDENHDKFGDAT